MTEDMICAYAMEAGTSTCQGDSGGPLVAADPDQCDALTLVGVASWGVECGEPGHPGFYAEVSHFIPWLHQQMPGLKTCPSYTPCNA